ncbi:M20/M25/M40 family metallo-hydrolase [Kitasatospora camelliae]|uniref:M20/M25/M40 family metallo-hydrolase n=1 Tax=Kitasatospora camelliae TaxID=3156397 RepID=A0AAU8K342_9ACTN
MTDELVREISALMPRARADLAELLALPSVAEPDRPPSAACRQAAAWVASAFAEAGLRDVHLAETADGSFAVLGHRPPPPGAPTVLLVCHYDVPPVPDAASWSRPPFRLTERRGGWYGRGAAGGKGAAVLHLTVLRALGEALPVGVKFLAEGAREAGGGGLAEYVGRHADELHAAVLLAAAPGPVRAGARAPGPPFLAAVAGGWGATAYDKAVQEVYGRPPGPVEPDGVLEAFGALTATYPGTEVLLTGLARPSPGDPGPEEGVDPAELARTARVAGLFLRQLAAARRR